MIDKLVIKPEPGVPAPVTRSRGRPKDMVLKTHVDAFIAMPVDDSFFVENGKRRDLEFLRRPVTALGANIEIVEVESDPIYHLPGVRCWRRTGLIDEI